jgi:four helix bundle protein
MESSTRAERPPTFEDGQDIRDRAFMFACHVTRFCHKVYEASGVGRMMVPQLITCSLSFATMLEEARAAESDADFISKCSISLKECRESWTRLRVCAECRIGPPADTRALVQEGNELIAIVTAIIRNKRRNVARKRVEAKRRGGSAPQSAEFQIPNS